MPFDQDELNRRREERQEERRAAAFQQRLLKIGLIVTAVTMVLCVSALLIARGLLLRPAEQPTDPALQHTEPPTVPPETVPQPTEPDRVIHFVMGGDLNVTDKTVSSGVSASGYDYTDVFLDVAPIFAGADLAALNLEGSMFGAPYGSENASAPAELLTALRNAGVDLIQAANSYSIANGLTGLRSTLQGITGAGMTPVGAYEDQAAFKESGGYVIREIQGVRVAVVAFTKGMDGMGLPAGSEHCVNLLYKDYNSAYQKVDTEGITAVLQAVAARKPDVTIALLHWGSEFNGQVSKTQERIETLMLEKGVDAIIGTHSHYVQQAKFDPAAGTLVAYSLGDFFGDAEKPGTNYSAILDLEITKSGATGQTSISGFDYIPVYIQDASAAGGGMRILRIREAVAAYENNFIDRVPEEVYLAMKSALTKVDERMAQESE